MRDAIETALIEWDWRMQDGIGTERQPRAFSEAIGDYKEAWAESVKALP